MAITVCYREGPGTYVNTSVPNADKVTFLHNNIGSCMGACPCPTFIETCYTYLLTCVNDHTHIEADAACTAGTVLHYGWAASDTWHVGGPTNTTFSHTLEDIEDGWMSLVTVGPANTFGARVVRAVPPCTSANYVNCTVGFADCNGLSGDGCETDILFSTFHCGVCNNECGTGYACSNGGCVAVCGDGIIAPPETCDDGNAIGGDGCSATCQLES